MASCTISLTYIPTYVYKCLLIHQKQKKKERKIDKGDLKLCP